MLYPPDLRGANIPPDLERLVRELAARMLNGPSVVHAILREQLARSAVALVTLTGAGFYAYFAVPEDARQVEPMEMIGGEVPMDVEGLDAPAGSLVKVKNGKLAFVEVYTFGDVPWPDHPNVLAYGETTPLPIPVRAS